MKWNLVTGEGGETKGKWRDDILSSAYGIPNRYGEGEVETTNVTTIPLLPDQQRLLGGVSGFIAEFVSVRSVGQPFGRHYLYRRDESSIRFGSPNSLRACSSTAATVSTLCLAGAGKRIQRGSGYGTNVNGVITFPPKAYC